MKFLIPALKLLIRALKLLIPAPKLLIPALTASLLLAGCSPARVDAYPVPPPLPAEQIPLPPVSDDALVWRPGDWVFTGGSYRYDAGRYVPAAGHGNRWLFGHWTSAGGQTVWVPGGWI